MHTRSNSMFHVFTLCVLLAALLASAVTVTPVGAATLQTDINGPSGSGQFGSTVTTLPNGNFIVTDPYYDAPGPIANVGAVHLYNGATHALISTLTGSSAGDQVGGNGITVLTNGNYVVVSLYWDGAAADVGAVTWGNGTSGVSGVVSAANSLVGSTANDQVGYGGITTLKNGNYVVRSQYWAGAAVGVGAVTWGSGTTGVSGVVSSANSLVGSTLNDSVGYGGVTALTNGNYVVSSFYWDGAAVDVGAVTWGSGTSGVSGVVSAANSLVGSTLNDNAGFGVTALTNGNYVVSSYNWDGAAVDIGAVTWGSGTSGVSGVVSASNSLVGSSAGDQVGRGSVTALTNGNYVVASFYWDGAAADVGAVTWGTGAGGIVGTVSAANSLVGSTAGDRVGDGGVFYGVTALTNGNYVVRSPYWDGAAVDVGAATWGSGAGGTVGVVSAANSLVGSTAGDYVGSVTALTNGNYVVTSPGWDGAAADVGAVTWGSGTSGVIGVVSAANSLVGSTASDQIGSGYGVTALPNGNYVVASFSWDGAAVDVGAVTWGSGTSSMIGVVSAANSLIGSTANDQVGHGGVIALTNGSYVVISYYWDGAAIDVGAVTWGSGTSGVSGVVSSANSLVGSTAGDSVGTFGGVIALTNGNYVVASYLWDGAAMDVGAVTWGNGTTGMSGVVSTANSLVGSTAGDMVGAYGDVTALTNGNYVIRSSQWDGAAVDSGAISFGKGAGAPPIGPITAANSVRGTAGSGGMNFAYDDTNDQLVVGRPADNIVTLFKITLPSLTSSVRVNPSPTSLASVDFTVTFSESVAGVDASDFSLTTTGVSGAAIIYVSGSGTTRTVTVNTGSGSGTIRLDVVDNDSIKDAINNPLGGIGGGNGNYSGGEIYTIDKTSPALASIIRANANLTNAASVDFTATFSEAVTGVDAGDFALTTTSITGAAITGVSGSGATRTVTVNTGSGSGTIRLDVVDDDSIKDAANNPLGGVGVGNGNYSGGEIYMIDKTSPAISSITRVNANPTNATSVDFTATFSEAVTGVDDGDFALTATGVSGAAITGVSGSGATRTITVNTGSGNGTIGLDVGDDDSIKDVANNPLGGIGVGNGNYASGETYTIDKTSPAISSITRVHANPTNATSVSFTVTFSKSVTGVDASDFALTTTGVTGAAIIGVSGSGTTYTITVNTGSRKGTIRLDVVDDDSIKDVVNNTLGGVGVGNGSYISGETYGVYRIDTTGVFRPSNGLLYLKNANTTGFADVAINYGTGGDYPVVGDWDGNGTATIGIYRNGSFYLRNSNTLGFADMVFAFGQLGDQPVAGDWNGDGTDTIGIFRPSTGQFLLRDNNSAGAADYSFYLGNVGDVGIAGDWTAKGFDTVGVFRPSNGIIFLKNTNQTGFADIALNYGLAGDQPVVGDWDGNGTDTIGVYRNAQFLLRNSNTIGFADIVFGLGNPGDMPIAGDWDGVP